MASYLASYIVSDYERFVATVRNKSNACHRNFVPVKVLVWNQICHRKLLWFEIDFSKQSGPVLKICSVWILYFLSIAEIIALIAKEYAYIRNLF